MIQEKEHTNVSEEEYMIRILEQGHHTIILVAIELMVVPTIKVMLMQQFLTKERAKSNRWQYNK